MAPKVKICGLRNEADIAIVNENHVDYAGFVIFPKSKRYITPQGAQALFAKLDARIARVAVTVSPDAGLVREIEDAGFQILQVHDNLTAEVLKMVQIPVWYAVNLADGAELEEKTRFIQGLEPKLAEKIKGLLIDGSQYGAGRPFNWRKSKRLLKAGAQSPPDIFGGRLFILAGGLSSENVAEGIALFDPDAVDVSSAVEGADGKDADKVRQFTEIVKRGQQDE